ncbi:hypothetical protein ASE40_07380 [Flavobacterium sp. Root935]|jgi:hypothetical protein|uniref:hypothetical protein n=1 Tax=unclassified Flavobacterium TaxID=196869 RepID=UPI00070FDEA4|nr:MULTISPECIES: hypothetical protein [unclassified Flavobacterium]KRD61351.1 hypothetical protein ASE40_07380 [Flavobacterium sp. Root935]MDQ1166553.1 hypothetical protein [Flavobacterium sp. SORGH_AS_0622]
MNLDEKENYGQKDQYFQNDRDEYEDPDIDLPPVDHSITENAEPDYSTDFVINEDANLEEEDDDDLENDLDDEDDEDQDSEESIKKERDTYDNE